MWSDKSHFCFLVFFIFGAFFCLSGVCITEASDEYFEVGLGGGTSLANFNTKQILIAPSISWKVKDMELLRFRFEGDLELIEHDELGTIIGGVAQFLRILFSPEDNVAPFFEVGAGLNLSNHNVIAHRKLGGGFLFSLMGGAGVEFKTKGKLLSLSTRFRHLSNGNLFPGNQSINSQYLIFSMGF